MAIIEYSIETQSKFSAGNGETGFFLGHVFDVGGKTLAQFIEQIINLN